MTIATDGPAQTQMDAATGERIVTLAQSCARRIARTNDEHAIDELASAIIEKSVKSWHTYDARWALSTWVNRIGSSVRIDQLRRRRPDGQMPEEYDVPDIMPTDDLVIVAEGIRERAIKAYEGEKQRVGGRGFGREARLSIALLCAHTGWSARRMAIALKKDDALREALGLPRAPGFRTVAWCASVCAFVATFRKLLS